MRQVCEHGIQHKIWIEPFTIGGDYICQGVKQTYCYECELRAFLESVIEQEAVRRDK